MIWLALLAQSMTTIQVDPSVELGSISRAMYGSCIEDVNHEIYGGLYAQTIYGESFEEPVSGSKPKGWDLFGGNWVPDANGVHVSSGPGYKLVSRQTYEGDQEIEAEVAIANDFGTNAGFVVKANNLGVGADQFDGYEISLSARDHRIILGKHQHNFRSLAEASAPLSNGRWHHLRVKTNGSKIQIFLDHEPQPRIDFNDSPQSLKGGKVGLRTWHSDASFRNVKVNGQSLSFDWSAAGTSPRWDPIQSPNSKGTRKVVKEGFNGSYSQVISNLVDGERTGVANRGLNKWGIAAWKGQAMAGGIAVKGDQPIILALQSSDGSRTYATTSIQSEGKTWKFREYTLTPNSTDSNCRLAIWIDRRGEVAIDQVQLFQPKSNLFKGLPVRADIVAKMKESGITFLRYGGTMVNTQNYRWKNMIGLRELRPPYAGHWNSSSTNGFGIFDFLNLCESAGMGHAFAINSEETPEDAADLADYLTAPLTNPWGKRRAEDGHPKPYNMDFIQIGNEECISGQSAQSFKRYCDQFERIAKAIHSRNPKLKLVCSAWWVDNSPEMETVFRRIDGLAAAWDIHVGGDDTNSGSQVEKLIGGIKDKFNRWNPKSKLKIVIFEENGSTHNLKRALGHATNVNAARRFGDFVLVDCAANCLQPIQQNDNGWDQGQIFFNSSKAWLMPPALANQLLSEGHQPIRVQTLTDSPVDVVAAKSQDGMRIVMTIVNIGDKPMSTNLTFNKFIPQKWSAKVVSGKLSDVNSSTEIRTPINNLEVSHAYQNWMVAIPAHSISTIEFSR